MPRYNYPKHPLFGIAPLLYNWRGDVRHDEYTSALVGRIRAGRYTRDLFDSNSLYLTYTDRTGSHVVPSRRFAAESRATMSPEERRAKRAADEAQYAEQAERNRQAAEERRRVKAEYLEAIKRHTAERERQDREWAEAVARDAERLRWIEAQDRQRAEAHRQQQRQWAQELLMKRNAKLTAEQQSRFTEADWNEVLDRVGMMVKAGDGPP